VNLYTWLLLRFCPLLFQLLQLALSLHFDLAFMPPDFLDNSFLAGSLRAWECIAVGPFARRKYLFSEARRDVAATS
jgi:hypothetical protein